MAQATNILPWIDNKIFWHLSAEKVQYWVGKAHNNHTYAAAHPPTPIATAVAVPVGVDQNDVTPEAPPLWDAVAAVACATGARTGGMPMFWEAILPSIFFSSVPGRSAATRKVYKWLGVPWHLHQSEFRYEQPRWHLYFFHQRHSLSNSDLIPFLLMMCTMTREHVSCINRS